MYFRIVRAISAPPIGKEIYEKLRKSIKGSVIQKQCLSMKEFCRKKKSKQNCHSWVVEIRDSIRNSIWIWFDIGFCFEIQPHQLLDEFFLFMVHLITGFWSIFYFFLSFWVCFKFTMRKKLQKKQFVSDTGWSEPSFRQNHIRNIATGRIVKFVLQGRL